MINTNTNNEDLPHDPKYSSFKIYIDYNGNNHTNLRNPYRKVIDFRNATIIPTPVWEALSWAVGDIDLERQDLVN